MDFSERVSSVFGSLNATLKSFSDSPCKQDPDEELKQGQSKGRSSSARDEKPASSHTSRDRSPHRRQHHVTRERHRPARVPCHVVHPKKWTKYDLSDDGTKNSDFKGLSSDQVNRKAAFEFLNTLKHKDSETTPSETTPTDTSLPLKFKKPSKVMKEVSKETKDHDHDHQSVSGPHSSGAMLMPEYVVGAKKQQRPARPTAQASRSSASSVMLSHLGNDDEEDEEP